MRGLGKLVIVDHSGGYITVYAHLNEIDVKDDQEIENGTVIGRVNLGGVDSSLHFEIRKSSNALDPNDWLE
jgi:murein DD-endopeptidase MepM/ murein hydrolase activator NlpD